MKNNLQEKDYIKILNKIIKSGLRSCCKTFNYQEVADSLLSISGAMVVAFNLYNEEKTKTKTVAIAGDSKIIKKASRMTGFNIIGKEWEIIPERISEIKKKRLLQSTNLHDVSFGAINKKTAKTIEGIFGIGDIYLLKISYNDLLGDFLLFFKKGETIKNKSLVTDFIGHVESILMRYRVEKNMQENEERYKELASQSRTFIWEVDKNARYTYVSENVRDIIGYTAKEIIGKKTVFDLHPKEGIEEFKKDVLNTIKKKIKIQGLENPIISKDGSVVWVLSAGIPVLNEKGRLVSYRGSDTNISEIKKFEDDLKKNKEKYETLVANIPGTVYRCLPDKKWTMKYISEEVKEITGYASINFIDNNVFTYESVIHPDDRKHVYENIKRALKGKKPWDIEYRINKKNGELVWVQEKGVGIFDKNNKNIFLDGFILDITKRKKIESALRKKEEQFELAVKGSNDGIWDWDLVSNKLYLSPQWKAQLGYKDNELKNEFTTFKKLLHPDDKERILKSAQDYIEGKKEHYREEFRMIHKNGTEKWILAKGSAAYDSKGKPNRIAGSHSDITERKNYELKLSESEEKFRQITENTGEVFWLRSADNKEMLYVNPAYERVWGVSQESLYKNPQSFISSILDEDKPVVFKAFENYIRSGKFDLEYRIVRPDGEVRWVHAKSFPVKNTENKIIRHTGIAVDITERKKTEKEIFEKNEELRKFKLAVENASDHIVITDSEGVCLYMNKAAEETTGFKKEEILGEKVGTSKNWGGLMDKDIYKQLWKTIKKERKDFYGELNNKRKNGEKYNALASISPIIDSENNVLFFVGIERDVTKEKEIDRAKTEFVSLASHQLRTPLSSINWYAEILLDGDAGPVNDEQEVYLQEIYKGNQRMVELVNTLLNVSRLELGSFSIEPVKTDVKKILENVINEITPLVKEKRQIIKEDYKMNVPLIKHDPNLLNIVFQNIISNAVKYTPPKGLINISVFLAKKGDIVKKKKIKEEGIIITVKDSGYGIPQKQKEKIFGKLFRADNIMEKDTEGTGLGLYIVKSIMDQSGGDVWFDSLENKGTTFYLLIPSSGVTEKKSSKKLT